jgi:hypothetical protein
MQIWRLKPMAYKMSIICFVVEAGTRSFEKTRHPRVGTLTLYDYDMPFQNYKTYIVCLYTRRTRLGNFIYSETSIIGDTQ